MTIDICICCDKGSSKKRVVFDWSWVPFSMQDQERPCLLPWNQYDITGIIRWCLNVNNDPKRGSRKTGRFLSQPPLFHPPLVNINGWKYISRGISLLIIHMHRAVLNIGHWYCWVYTISIRYILSLLKVNTVPGASIWGGGRFGGRDHSGFLRWSAYLITPLILRAYQ